MYLPLIRFDDLKTGLAFLRRKVTTHDEGPLAFMKSNVSSIMSCLEALESMCINYVINFCFVLIAL